MYLREIHVENNGPLRRLALLAPFSENGLPKPLILVGQNGSGKTNLLSIIGDCLIEAGSHAFEDITHRKSSSRSWFRVAGGSVLSDGTNGGFSVARFEHNEENHYYCERSGTFNADDARPLCSATLHPGVVWSKQGKEFKLKREVAENIFKTGVYLYFPTSRSESPHWMNQASTSGSGFSLTPRRQGVLSTPIFVEAGLERFSQWLLEVLTDARVPIKSENGTLVVQAHNSESAISAYHALQEANVILRTILADENASFEWVGRGIAGKLGIKLSEGKMLHGLHALSGGQATLLSVFGTLLSYSDQIGRHSKQVPGICIIDEIDAHMHVDLQVRAIPLLISLFPHVQFIVSSHSPLLPLGLMRRLGDDKFTLIEMPSGDTISPEGFGEFGHAFDVLRDTQTFSKTLQERLSAEGKPLILVEGETDPRYLSAAAVALGRENLLQNVDIEWVGAKEPGSGQGFMTGKDSLNQAFNFLRANPRLIQRDVLLLADNDVNKPEFDQGRLHYRCMPGVPEHQSVTAGIESYLPHGVFEERFFTVREQNKRNGCSVTYRELNKSALCDFVSIQGDAESFEGFGPVLDLIESALGLRSDRFPVTEDEDAAPVPS